MVFDDFDKAQEAADSMGLRVCGTLLQDGTPKYFLANDDSTDIEIRDRAFEIRNGRPMTGYERWCLETAEKLHGNLQGELVEA